MIANALRFLPLILLCGVTGPASVQDDPMPVTRAVIAAGGGAGAFHTTELFHSLAGNLAGAEIMKLRMQFGRRQFAEFATAFEFTVADFARLAKAERVDLTGSPRPDPHDGKAMAAALLQRAALPDGTYSVAALMDRLLTPRLHAKVLADLAAAYGGSIARSYQTVLLQALLDMKRANHL